MMMTMRRRSLAAAVGAAALLLTATGCGLEPTGPGNPTLAGDPDAALAVGVGATPEGLVDPETKFVADPAEDAVDADGNPADWAFLDLQMVTATYVPEITDGPMGRGRVGAVEVVAEFHGPLTEEMMAATVARTEDFDPETVGYRVGAELKSDAQGIVPVPFVAESGSRMGYTAEVDYTKDTITWQIPIWDVPSVQVRVIAERYATETGGGVARDETGWTPALLLP